MRVLFRLVAIALAISCASSPVYTTPGASPPGVVLPRQCDLPVFVAVTDDTPAALRPLIFAAFEHWNVATGRRLFVRGGVVESDLTGPAPGGFTIVRVVPDDPETGDACALTRFAAFASGCMYFANVELFSWCAAQHADKPELLSTVLRHEAGHVLGLQHSTTFTDLLFYRLEHTIPHPVDVAAWELDEIRARYGAGPALDE